VSIKSQRKINEKREQVPESKEIKPRILKRTKALLKDWNGVPLDHTGLDLSPSLTVEDAAGAMSIPSSSAGLVVTSPPFLDVVDYQGDNWMRCWFLGIDASTVEITELKKPEDWKAKMTEVMRDLSRILKPSGYLAFEVGEVTYKREKLLLEELVLEAGVEAGLEPVIIMINDQEFTKTSNAWGVDNKEKGTNTNRIVIFRRVRMADAVIALDPETIAEGMGVDVEDVYEIMNDGTGASPWISKRIITELGLSEDTDDTYKDASSDEGDMEFKGITNASGVHLVPSNMVGSGRKVDWEKLDVWLGEIPGGFVLHDNTEFPHVPIYQIPTSTVRGWVEDGLVASSGKMTYNKIMDALEEL